LNYYNNFYYLGDDCSIRDCRDNCSFNGWCSIEFPVSRCMCDPTYFGDVCQYKQCLNNCSWPNGDCNYETGACECKMMYSPYLNTRPFVPWQGEDCSYLHPYETGYTLLTSYSWHLFIILITIIITLLFI